MFHPIIKPNLASTLPPKDSAAMENDASIFIQTHLVKMEDRREAVLKNPTPPKIVRKSRVLINFGRILAIINEFR
jgi:hypothetical protein